MKRNVIIISSLHIFSVFLEVWYFKQTRKTHTSLSDKLYDLDQHLNQHNLTP